MKAQAMIYFIQYWLYPYVYDPAAPPPIAFTYSHPSFDLPISKSHAPINIGESGSRLGKEGHLNPFI
jgi:hypothetical protein